MHSSAQSATPYRGTSFRRSFCFNYSCLNGGQWEFRSQLQKSTHTHFCRIRGLCVCLPLRPFLTLVRLLSGRADVHWAIFAELHPLNGTRRRTRRCTRRTTGSGRTVCWRIQRHKKCVLQIWQLAVGKASSPQAWNRISIDWLAPRKVSCLSRMTPSHCKCFAYSLPLHLAE